MLLILSQVLTEAMNAERPFVTAAQLREMNLGLRNLKFHYLHLLILILKGDTERASVRLAAARESLSLLPSMVSNWESVYNGAIWYERFLLRCRPHETDSKQTGIFYTTHS